MIPLSKGSHCYSNGNPLQYSYLENVMDRGAWQATVHGTAESWTRLSPWARTSDWYQQMWAQTCVTCLTRIYSIFSFICLWYIYLIIYPWKLMGDVNWKRNKCKSLQFWNQELRYQSWLLTKDWGKKYKLGREWRSIRFWITKKWILKGIGW